MQDLELFTEAMEDDFYNPNNIQKPTNNLNKNETIAFK